MKSKKCKLSAVVFYSVIITLALGFPNMAFAEQSGDFTYTESGGTITITKYTGTGGNVVIPDAINGQPVVGIGDQAFMYCSSLASVTIPNSVTSIGFRAFSSCSSLASVTIGNSVTSIGYMAFEFCSGLTSVTIPDSVTSIGGRAFFFCSGLTSVTIGNSVTSIESRVFGSCSGLTSVTIGNSVTSIGDQAFMYCSGLTSVVIPDSVTSIGGQAFYYCTGLTSVVIPDSVTSIGNEAFDYCSGLTSVVIPDSVTSIGGTAFRFCFRLTTAYFYGNAPLMGGGVFDSCASNFSICYTAGSSGFTTPTWCPLDNPCYPASECEATLIELSSFTATPRAGKVILQWSTEAETDNAGFNLYRSESENGEYIKINSALIAAEGSPTQGASYEFIDNDVKNRKAYFYKLEDIDLNDTKTMHGPESATPRLIYGIGK